MNQKQKLVYDVQEILNFRELITRSAELYGERCAFIFREGKGVREITYGEVMENVKAFSTYLNSLGLEGKKIGVVGKNCYFWALSYLAVCAGTGVICRWIRN